MKAYRTTPKGGPLSIAIWGIRNRLKKNQQQMADLLGCASNTVSQYESGKCRPNLEKLMAFLRLAETDCERSPILTQLGRHGILTSELSTALNGAAGSAEQRPLEIAL